MTEQVRRNIKKQSLLLNMVIGGWIGYKFFEFCGVVCKYLLIFMFYFCRFLWIFYKFIFFDLPLCVFRLCGCKWFDRLAWSKWSRKTHDIHEMPQQRERRLSAMHEDMRVKRHIFGGNATVYGSTGTPYVVTLRSCSCSDFEKRQLPCKHMYLLAMTAGVCPRIDEEKANELN